jgi:hypothetical protein
MNFKLRNNVINFFKYSIIVFSFVSVFLLQGCVSQKYKDVSDEEQYKALLGMEFKSKIELLGIGITFDANYNQEVDYIFIMPKPGVTGPEVVFKKRLAKGVNFKLVGVLESDGLFNNRIFYVIKFIDNKFFSKYTVIVKVFDDISNQNKGLSEDRFDLISSSNNWGPTKNQWGQESMGSD